MADTEIKADPLVFDDTMKKKKKKVSSKDIPVEEEKKKKSSSKSKSTTEESTEAVEGEKKKKKSSSKSKSTSEESTEAVEGEKKKKKSSSSKSKSTSEESSTTPTAEDDEQFGNIDFSKKKKKSSRSKEPKETEDTEDNKETSSATTTTTTTTGTKKPSPYHTPIEDESTKTTAVEEDEDDFDPSSAPGGITWLGTDRDYKYSELTYRIYHLIGNSELASDQKRVLKPPQVFRETTKKTVWANFAEICQTLNRKPDHVLSYVFAELGTNGSIDGNDRLIIRGRFNTSQIEIVIRHYISEYVGCRNCKSPNTTLERNNRLYFLCCNACNSKRTVVVIKKGLELGKKQPKE